MARPADYERGEEDTWAAQAFPPGHDVDDVIHLYEVYGIPSPISGDKTQHYEAGLNRDLEGPDA